MLLGFVKKGQSLFILSFTALVLLAVLILKLPWCYRDGVLSWPDAFFMATSAVCVNGLAVVPINDFTLFGQLMILAMVQVGGIGIMTLSASILLMLGRGLSFSDTLLISSLSDNFSLRGTEGLTRTIVHYTLACEALGMLIMLPGFWMKYPFADSLWYAFFHAITGFCNAGLSPFPDSLAGQTRLTQFGVAALIILGGLGVYVIYDLILVCRRKARTLRLHSKVVLFTNLVLIVGGAVLLWILAIANNSAMRWFDAFFLSISARTAGFTSFDITTAFPGGSVTLLIILMLIGASPGSTGGGMKTSTVAVAASAILNTLKGNRDVLLFKRRIPTENVMRAFTIIVLFILLACFGAISIQLLTPATGMMEAFFESASAFSTTGLTIGVTGKLTGAGKLLLSFFMFCGRIGPFTIMLFLLGREKHGKLKYPEERIIIS